MGDDMNGEPSKGHTERKRTRIVRPYPTHTLEDAIAVARAIQESNSGLPFDRALLARAMGTTPASSGYTMKLNSSAKYGLTQGGYNDDRISLTPRGEAIVAPKGVGEQLKAIIDAAIQPDVFGRFYRMLDGKRLPEDTFAQNMLQREFGVRPDLTGECLRIIEANGLYTAILQAVDGSLHVSLAEGPQNAPSARDGWPQAESGPEAADLRPASPAQGGRVFIGHSRSTEAVQFVKSVFDEFGIAYGAGEAEAGDLQPVSAAVSNEMRSCSAAVLVFGGDDGPVDGGGDLTSQMAYQLGAASVLYGNKVIVFREAGLEMGRDLTSLRAVEFEAERPEMAGLALLRELNRLGVIRVVV